MKVVNLCFALSAYLLHCTCSFQPGIPSQNAEGRATTQRAMPILWGHYVHILAQFEDVPTLRSAAAEFLGILETVSKSLRSSADTVCINICLLTSSATCLWLQWLNEQAAGTDDGAQYKQKWLLRLQNEK